MASDKNGHARVPFVVVRQFGRELGPSGLAVYLGLATHADARGECWPSVKRIAEEIGVTPRTVRRALAHLCRLKLLSVTPRPYRSSVYRLTPVDGMDLFFHEGGGALVSPPWCSGVTPPGALVSPPWCSGVRITNTNEPTPMNQHQQQQPGTDGAHAPTADSAAAAEIFQHEKTELISTLTTRGLSADYARREFERIADPALIREILGFHADETASARLRNPTGALVGMLRDPCGHWQFDFRDGRWVRPPPLAETPEVRQRRTAAAQDAARERRRQEDQARRAAQEDQERQWQAMTGEERAALRAQQDRLLLEKTGIDMAVVRRGRAERERREQALLHRRAKL